MTEWTPQERKDAARQIVNSLADMAGLRPATHELVAEAWAGGEVTLCISNQVAIELACQRNLALWALNDVHDFLKSHGYDTTLIDSAIAACTEGK